MSLKARRHPFCLRLISNDETRGLLPSSPPTVSLAAGGKGQGATATLRVNGKDVATTKLTATVAGRFGVDSFRIGEYSGQPVTFDYAPPNAFTGTIKKVEIALKK